MKGRFILVQALALTACVESVEKLDSGWLVQHRLVGIDSGGTVSSLYRVGSWQNAKVDDYLLLWRAYGDDCVVYERAGPRAFYGVCGDRIPVFITRAAHGLEAAGVIREGEMVVRDGAPWRRRRVIPIEEIKRHAVAMGPYKSDWRTTTVTTGATEISGRLEERRVGIEERDKAGRTPLMWFVIREDATSVGELIRTGADVNAGDRYGTTVLLLAIDTEEDRLEIVRMLVSAGAAVNTRIRATGETPLILAVRKRHPQIALALIRAGADVNAQLTGGETPLLLAERANLRSVTDALRAAGAK